MLGVRKSEIPMTALVKAYQGQPKTRIDCYKIYADKLVNLEYFVGRFYRGRLFRIERALISRFTGHPSSDKQLNDLLSATSKTFSAWTQSARNENQLIMCDYQGRTCSWFMVEPQDEGTSLYFGTVLKPTQYFKGLEWLSKPIFTLFLPAHGLYSRLLLGAAAKG